jgi:hypothetical protein
MIGGIARGGIRRNFGDAAANPANPSIGASLTSRRDLKPR